MKNRTGESEAGEFEAEESDELKLSAENSEVKTRKRLRLQTAWIFRVPIFSIPRQPRSPSRPWITTTSAATAAESV